MFSTNDYWEILKVIQGQDGDVTDAIAAIAKSEGANSENFFRNIIDQIAYYSDDYVRLRSFLRDWYATHRTIATFQTTVSDVYSIPNDQLDELFRSFGYNYSTSIRFPQSNNPPLEKSNFFLDLVNLYKVKGTPQGMLDVLQYYGVGELSLYEFFLQFDNRPNKDLTELVFRGNIAATTSTNRSDVFFDYNVLTFNDPHWLYTEQQIKNLHLTTKLNLPSRTPYFAVQPIFDESTVSISMALLVRRIQDLYEDWRVNGNLPPLDANCTATGEAVSVLALYLACLYFFDKEWNVSVIGDHFVCYDGSETNINTIIENHNRYTQERPDNRADIVRRIAEYNDLYTRENPRNFLQSRTDAQYFLNLIYPDYLGRLDSLTDRYSVTLSSLLNDLGDWVKYNLNYGFINLNYFTFGLDALFSKLKDVITFFKPYHARIVPIEAIAFRNRTFNTIIVEDVFETVQLEQMIHDFLTGNSRPCCAGLITDCPQPILGTQYHARDLYDCGSFFDIGAATDIRDDVYIEPQLDINDYVICTPTIDSTSIVQTYVLGTNPDVVTDESYVDETLFGYWQMSGKADFDDYGRFDCSTGTDFLELVVEDVNGSSSSSSSNSSSSSLSLSSSSSLSAVPLGLCSEDYTGTDGAAPDETVLAHTYNVGTPVPAIYNNKLRYEPTSGSIRHDYTTTFSFNSEFDIYVDFATPRVKTPTGTADFIYLGLVEGDTWISFNYGNTHNSPATAYYDGDMWDGGSNWTYSFVTSTDVAGKLRMRRATNGNIYVYYWNESLAQWEWNGNTAGMLTENYLGPATIYFDGLVVYDSILDIGEFITTDGCDDLYMPT